MTVVKEADDLYWVTSDGGLEMKVVNKRTGRTAKEWRVIRGYGQTLADRNAALAAVQAAVAAA